MKKISFWARNHQWQARFLIIISYVILNVLGLFLGDVLALSQIIIPAPAIYATCFIFLTGFIFYPLKGVKTAYKNFYQRQKITDLVLITTTFLLIIGFGNRYNTAQSLFFSSLQTIQATASKPVSFTIKKHSNGEPVLEKKKGRKTLKAQLKQNIHLLRKEYKEATKGEKAVLILLSVLGAALLLYLLAALSCSISCSGAEGAAIVLGVLGTGLIIFLLVKVIKRINRGKPIKETVPGGSVSDAPTAYI